MSSQPAVDPTAAVWSRPTQWVSLLMLFDSLAVVCAVNIAIGFSTWWAVIGLVVFVVVVNAYLVLLIREDAFLPRSHFFWLLVLSIIWMGLVMLEPSAAYLLFPLCILLVWTISTVAGILFASLLALVAVWVFASEVGATPAGVIGPILGAMVACAGAWLYLRIQVESAEREAVLQELRNTQAQLALAERATGQMTERARIAQDLHDTTAQGLISIQMLLRSVEVADVGHPQHGTIVMARETAANELAEVRRVINDLTPTSLAHGGLASALDQIATEVTNRTSIRVTATSKIGDPDAVTSLAAQIALLRIAQGAVANVERHSRASVSTIVYTVDEGYASVHVSDNGRGTVTQQDLPGFGLATMYERMHDFGGTLTVTSKPGEGTTVFAKVPLSS